MFHDLWNYKESWAFFFFFWHNWSSPSPEYQVLEVEIVGKEILGGWQGIKG